MEVSGGDLKKYRTKYCFLEIGDEKGKEFIELGVRVLPRPCGSLRHLDWNSVKHHFPHFSKVSLMVQVNRGQVDMIIGTDCSTLLAATGPDILGNQLWHPIIRQTKLGNIPMGVFGPNLKKRRTKRASFMNSNDPGEKPSVHEDMRKIFNVEDHQTEYFLQKSAPVKRITPSHD